MVELFNCGNALERFVERGRELLFHLHAQKLALGRIGEEEKMAVPERVATTANIKTDENYTQSSVLRNTETHPPTNLFLI
jgi:hypothetical protein